MFRAAANPYDDIVAKATDENQTSEDWGLLSTVWDKVNDDGPTGARNCVGAIQKRLQHRSANVQLYSLTLADSLVMNCKVDLHREISSRAFTQTLTRLVQDRTTHDKVKKRVMQLLKNWSEHFKKDSTLGIVEETYEQLNKSYRVEDPATEAPAVPVSVLKQEEEDMQRAIAESEALARNQPSRTNYGGGNTGASTSYGQLQQSAGYSHAGSSNTGGGSNFFTQADGKALPDIQPEPSTSQHGASASAAAGGPSRVKALYDFEPQEDGELAFRKGDVIRVINSAYEGWWKGELDGRLGIFPLTYIEIIPDPTPESIARDAEIEAQVFTQAGNVDRLLAMLSAADAQGSSISDDDELMELYHQCILMRPKIVKLLDKYNQKQKDLASLHDKFKIAKTAYDTMLEESYSRQNGPMGQQQLQYGQPYGQAGYQQQPSAGAPPQSHYPGQQQYPTQAQGPYQGQGQAGAGPGPVPYMSPPPGSQPAGYAGPASTSPAPGQAHPHAHPQQAPMQQQMHPQHTAPGQQYAQTQYAPYPPQQQQQQQHHQQGGMPQPGQPAPPQQVNGYA